MDNIKIDRDKLLMVLINETIALKAENIAIKGALYGLTKILKPELADALEEQLERQKSNHLNSASDDFARVLNSESVDFQDFLKALLS